MLHSIIIPVFNEEKTILKILNQIENAGGLVSVLSSSVKK